MAQIREASRHCIVSEKAWEEFKRLAVLHIEDHYGERCPDVDMGCPLCRAWAGFDLIFGEKP